MEKIQVYLRKEELDALRATAALSRRIVSDLNRDTVGKVVLKPLSGDPVAIGDVEAEAHILDYDSIENDP